MARGLGWLIGALVCVTLTGSAAGQAIIRVVPGRGEIGADSRLHWIDYGRTRLGDGSSTTELMAWVALPLGGVLVDPRIFSWSLTLRPEFRRTTFSGAPEELRGRAFGWNGGFQLLPGRQLSASAQGGHHRSTGEGGFGTRTDNRVSTLNATVASAHPALPLQLTWNRQSTSAAFTNLVTGTEVATAFDTHALRLSGANSKTSVLIDRTWHDDRVGRADYAAWTVLLGHTARWGKGSSLESSLDLTDQSGEFAYARRQWTERVHLQHTRSTASILTWRQASTTAAGRRSDLRALTYDLGARLGRVASAGITWGHSATRANGTREVASTVVPRAGLALRDHGGAFLSASGSLGLEQRDRTGGSALVVPVVNESHRITPSRRFFLDLPDPDPLSIVVRNADQTITYVAGVDYEVSASEASVRIDVLPLSRVTVGETVLVSYSSRLPGDFDDTARISEYQISAGIGPLRLRHAANERNARAPAAVTDARGRADFAHASTTLDLLAGTGIGQLALNAALNRRERPGARIGELSVGGSLASQLGPSWQTSVGVYWSRTETNGVVARSTSGQSGVVWLPSTSLRVQLVVEALTWDQAPEPPIRQLAGSADVEWRFGQFETTLRLTRDVREDGGRFSMNRLTLRSRRRF